MAAQVDNVRGYYGVFRLLGATEDVLGTVGLTGMPEEEALRDHRVLLVKWECFGGAGWGWGVGGWGGGVVSGGKRRRRRKRRGDTKTITNNHLRVVVDFFFFSSDDGYS